MKIEFMVSVSGEEAKRSEWSEWYVVDERSWIFLCHNMQTSGTQMFLLHFVGQSPEAFEWNMKIRERDMPGRLDFRLGISISECFL